MAKEKSNQVPAIDIVLRLLDFFCDNYFAAFAATDPVIIKFKKDHPDHPSLMSQAFLEWTAEKGINIDPDSERTFVYDLVEKIIELEKELGTVSKLLREKTIALDDAFSLVPHPNDKKKLQ